MTAVTFPLRWLGEQVADGLAWVGRLITMVGRTIASIGERPIQLRMFGYQFLAIGVGSLGLTVLMAAFVGMVLAFQFGYGLQRFGAKLYIGQTTIAALFRELGPVLTALVVGARVGAGIAAELGGMAVTEQIDAARALGANPLQRLVAPRLVATTLVFPLLAICADLVGFLGGMLIASLQFDVSPQLFTTSVYDFLSIWDFLSGLVKALVFGFIIGAISCREGMRARGGTEGVGRATTRAVVGCALTVLAVDVFLTKLFLAP